MKLQDWMVEPINNGRTYQITTTERTRFVVIAETTEDALPDAALHAKLMSKSPPMLKALRLLIEHSWVDTPAGIHARIDALLAIEGLEEIR